MAAQADLVEVVHTLRQIVCVKGKEQRGESKRLPRFNARFALTCNHRMTCEASSWVGDRRRPVRDVMEIWLARMLALAALIFGGFVASNSLALPGYDAEAREGLLGIGYMLLAVGVFLAIFSARRRWYAHLDTAIGMAITAILVVGALYSAFVLREPEVAIACFLLLAFHIWSRISAAEQKPQPLLVEVGKFLFVMGRMFAAFVGGLGVAMLIIAPSAPAGWFLSAIGAVFLSIAYLAKRFLVGVQAWG